MPWFSATQRRHLAERSAALGLPFVDLSPALQAEARRLEGRELLYFPANVHYTPRGHRVVAEALARALETVAAAAPGAE
jgi:lysophospholipase L1-like esterase